MADNLRWNEQADAASCMSTKAVYLRYTHTNLTVTQDTDKVFIKVRPPCGRNTYVLHLIILNCVEIICHRGSLASPYIVQRAGLQI